VTVPWLKKRPVLSPATASVVFAEVVRVQPGRTLKSPMLLIVMLSVAFASPVQLAGPATLRVPPLMVWAAVPEISNAASVSTFTVQPLPMVPPVQLKRYVASRTPGPPMVPPVANVVLGAAVTVAPAATLRAAWPPLPMMTWPAPCKAAPWLAVYVPPANSKVLLAATVNVPAPKPPPFSVSVPLCMDTWPSSSNEPETVKLLPTVSVPP
jgi:hypothetical protein